MAVEMQLGALTASAKPSLPDEITVAVPVERRLSIAALRASPSQLAVCLPPPRLMFTAAMRMLDRRAMTRSSPLIWSLTRLSAHGLGLSPQSLPVKREKTLIAITFANGATPSNDAPLPAAMPATCVPCSQSPGAKVQGTPEPTAVELLTPPGQSPSEKHASDTTLPARKLCALSTPVSSTATCWLAPWRPSEFASVDSTMAVLWARCGSSSSSSWMLAARPERSSAASASGDSSSATDGIVSNVLTTRCFVPASAPTSRSRAPSIWARWSLTRGVVELALGREPRLQADDHAHRVLALEPLERVGRGARVCAVDRREPVRDRDLRRPGRAGFGGRGDRREQGEGEDGDRPRDARREPWRHMTLLESSDGCRGRLRHSAWRVLGVT